MVITKFARCDWTLFDHTNKGYILRHKVKINDKLFDSFELFKTKEDVEKFCEENDIGKEDLKKIWSSEKETIKYPKEEK